MENIQPSALTHQRSLAHHLVMVAKLGGRPVLLLNTASVLVNVDGLRETGRIIYVGADQTVGVRFATDPPRVLREFPTDKVRLQWGGLVLRAAIAHLATNPAIQADLDQPADELVEAV